MKTRMHRFWISVSLAAGSLAFPLSPALRGHDLPTRWTSGANSTPSWNYLLDDCLDMPQLPGSRSLTDVERTRRGTEDWASSCPTEWAADRNPGRPIDMEFEGILRNPISRFSKEMSCWVNEWQMIQASAAHTAPAKRLWAKLPDAGSPPAPDASLSYLTAYQSNPVADTCAFDAEYQARQTAADLLAREITRANQIATYEAAMSQAIVDADRVQAIIDMDAIPQGLLAAQPPIASDNQLRSALCGGESREIMSNQCFPNRYAPGLVDEYIAYDMDMRDHHWLGGLGKSWKLRSAVGNLPAPTMYAAVEESQAAGAWAVPVSAPDSALANYAPESFVAPDLVDAGSSVSPQDSDLARESAANDIELKTYFDSVYFDNIVQQAQLSALNLIHSVDSSAASVLPQADIQTVRLPDIGQALLPDLGQALATASDWVEDQTCLIAAELCGFDSAYQVGNWLGGQSLNANALLVDRMLAMGHYLDLPVSGSDVEAESDSEEHPGLDIYVIYVDSEGNSLAVPSSLARAWNRPEAEPTQAAEPMPAETQIAAADWFVLDQLGAQAVALLAKQLDSIGMSLMQTSDTLSSWAEMQIASREESSVR